MTALISHAQELQRAIIEPFDFQVENDPRSHVRGLAELYSCVGDLIYVPKEDPSIIRIDLKTMKILRFAGPGQGPGELGKYSAGGLSVNGNSVWALNDRRNIANFYVNGQFQTAFRLKDYQLRPLEWVKWSFAHNDQLVLVPAHPRTGHLARVYDYAGQETAMVGRILPIEPEMLEYNAMVNATIWQYREGKWYCLFAYRPIIRIYNAEFELEREILVVGEEVDLFEEPFHKREIPEGFDRPRPHFTDFQVTEKCLYLMCHGVLYQLDHTGKVLSRTGFWANDAIMEELGWRPRVEFCFAAVMKNGRVYLGARGNYMEHDLWYVDLAHVRE